MATEAEAIRRDLTDIGDEAFERALTAETTRRLAAFLKGIESYRAHPYTRTLPAAPVIWQDGTTRLLDYALPGATGPAILVVPSLINRAYVLDLTRQRSLMRYLAGKGMRPFMIDWDAPGKDEAGFALDDYVGGRLSRALEVVATIAGRPVLAGYCIGGLLSLALALLDPTRVRGLVLLATPWDFHRPSASWGRQVASLSQPLDDMIGVHGVLPADVLQMLFAAHDPSAVERKFRQFGALPPRCAQARNFVALEDWVNDCVPLAGPVARQCLFGWYVDNKTARGQWRICGKTMDPRTFEGPAMVVVPTRDRIVPAEGAAVLATNIPAARLLRVQCGHVGMVVGMRAKTDVYQPVAKWLAQFAG